MSITTGTRTTAATAGVVLIGGLTVSLHSAIHRNVPGAIGGLGITLAALTAIVLILIHRWVTDTRDERRALAALQREAQSQKATCIAAKAALENERGRLAQDVAAERAALTARLKAERAAIEREFEEERATLVAETMEATFLMVRDGKFDPSTARDATLIEFPRQHPQQERHAEGQRSRERGAVRP